MPELGYTTEQLKDITYELERELGMRRAVYPKLIAQRKISHMMAEQRTLRLEQARLILRGMLDAQRALERERAEEAIRVAVGASDVVGTLSRAIALGQEGN